MHGFIQQKFDNWELSGIAFIILVPIFLILPNNHILEALTSFSRPADHTYNISGMVKSLAS